MACPLKRLSMRLETNFREEINKMTRKETTAKPSSWVKVIRAVRKNQD